MQKKSMFVHLLANDWLWKEKSLLLLLASSDGRESGDKRYKVVKIYFLFVLYTEEECVCQSVGKKIAFERKNPFYCSWPPQMAENPEIKDIKLWKFVFCLYCTQKKSVFVNLLAKRLPLKNNPFYSTWHPRMAHSTEIYEKEVLKVDNFMFQYCTLKKSMFVHPLAKDCLWKKSLYC